MKWLNQELDTIGKLSDAIFGIIRDGTREDAQRFMAAYRAETPHAATNVGYLAGYYDSETARKIWDWFECAHPVFGTYVPTVEEALEAGGKLAEEANLKRRPQP
jgi:hypothetical protein